MRKGPAAAWVILICGSFGPSGKKSNGGRCHRTPRSLTLSGPPAGQEKNGQSDIALPSRMATGVGALVALQHGSILSTGKDNIS